MPTLDQSRQRAKDEKLQAHLQEDGSYIVYNTSKGTSYPVYKSPTTGVWYCTCLYAQKASHIRPGICKHLARVLDRENGCTSCGRKDVQLRDFKCANCRLLDRMGFE